MAQSDDTPPVPARGYGPEGGPPPSQEPYHHAAAGWGAAKSVGLVLLRKKKLFAGTKAVFEMNHENRGYDCPGCAWPDDRKGLSMDLCENGIKHVTWEITEKRATPAFFTEHTVTELMSWTDFALEDVGRLTHPMRYSAESDRYHAISWEEAFGLFGAHIRRLRSANESAYYTSGRLSNEATFLYQLFARELGTNNLPDCSNMCHEASGRALLASIGTGKGTCDLDDWEHADLLVIMGVNAATNAPRMLTSLKDACARGAEVVHVNPLIEVAATKTIVPHEILDMALFRTRPTGTLSLQPRIGGDMALLRGVAKHVFEASQHDPSVLDHAFLAEHTSGFDEYRAVVEATPWADLEAQSGLSVEQMRQLGARYVRAKSTIISWCLGVSQQKSAVDAIREITNVLLLRGNIGRPGAGPSPVRGHSNVQGNRTCGIHHDPPEDWLVRHDRATGIISPRTKGLDTVHVIPAMMRGEVKVFVGMGGNFALAASDPEYTFEALRKCDLTVQVSTKLNRSHLVHGKDALILPCLGRTEIDMQKEGPQGITVEDGMSEVHLSWGRRRPPSPHLKSECAIIAGFAKAALVDSPTPWDAYVDNYDYIRDTMASALEGFEDFNARVRRRLGFRIAQPARERVWRTPSGRATFSAAALSDVRPPPGRLVLGTMRSHDQWNTTIYSNDDRYRGVKNLRTLVFMNADDMVERGVKKLERVDITSYSKDGSTRRVYGYRAIPYAMPRGSALGYMPELNVLVAVGDFSEQSEQPSTKEIEVEIVMSRVRD